MTGLRPFLISTGCLATPQVKGGVLLAGLFRGWGGAARELRGSADCQQLGRIVER